MPETLGKCPALLLRRLFLASRNRLRLRRAQEDCPPRSSPFARVHHVALLRAIAAAGGFRALRRGWRHTASALDEAGFPLGLAQSLHQKRRRMLPFAVVQGSRGGYSTRG